LSTMALRTQRRRVMSALFDVMTTGIVAGIALIIASDDGRPEILALAGPMALAVLFRRRFPVTVMAVVSCLAFGQVLSIRRVPELYDVAVLIALYSVVKYARYMWQALLAGAVAALGVVIVVVVRNTGSSPFSEGIMYAAICAAVWLTAYVLRTRRLY